QALLTSILTEAARAPGDDKSPRTEGARAHVWSGLVVASIRGNKQIFHALPPIRITGTPTEIHLPPKLAELRHDSLELAAERASRPRPRLRRRGAEQIQLVQTLLRGALPPAAALLPHQPDDRLGH